MANANAFPRLSSNQMHTSYTSMSYRGSSPQGRFTLRNFWNKEYSHTGTRMSFILRNSHLCSKNKIQYDTWQIRHKGASLL